MGLSLAITLASFAAPEPPQRIPVVVTTDCGVEVDDQWALVHLALSPKVALRAIVTTHAPSFIRPASERSAKAAREIVAKLPPDRRPLVMPGSPIPLSNLDEPSANDGVDLILKETRDGTPDRRVVVVVIGAATDVASALLIDPSFADRVEVVAMGFDGWEKGGDPWNVKNDVKAWQVLLDSRLPLVVGDCAVSKRCLVMSSPEAHRRLDHCGPLGTTLADILDKWLTANPDLAAKATASVGRWPIWDEVTVAHILGMTEVDVRHRPSLRSDLSLDHSGTRGTVRWIREVDSERLWIDLAENIRRADLLGR